jgi:hypothetical protein
MIESIVEAETSQPRGKSLGCPAPEWLGGQIGSKYRPKSIFQYYCGILLACEMVAELWMVKNSIYVKR